MPDERGRATAQPCSSTVAPQLSFLGTSTTRATTDAILEPKPELFHSVSRQQPVEGKRSVELASVLKEPAPSRRRARSVPGWFHTIMAPRRHRTRRSERFTRASRSELGYVTSAPSKPGATGLPTTHGVSL
jgi:hypothetical protein